MSWAVLDPIPVGVVPLREYPSLKATLVHCTHDEAHRVARLGRPACSVCHGDDATTQGFELPVKFMAELPSGGQSSLFG